MTKSELAKAAAMSDIYLHQLFSGRRFPSRSKAICLCLGLSATLEETQDILRHCRFAALYPANRRDAIIIFGLLNGQTVFQVNDALFTENEETLF